MGTKEHEGDVDLPPEIEDRLTSMELRIQLECAQIEDTADDLEPADADEVLDLFDEPSVVRHVEDVRKANASVARTAARVRRESTQYIRPARLGSKGA